MNSSLKWGNKNRKKLNIRLLKILQCKQDFVDFVSCVSFVCLFVCLPVGEVSCFLCCLCCRGYLSWRWCRQWTRPGEWLRQLKLLLSSWWRDTRTILLLLWSEERSERKTRSVMLIGPNRQLKSWHHFQSLKVSGALLISLFCASLSLLSPLSSCLWERREVRGGLLEELWAEWGWSGARSVPTKRGKMFI